MVVGKTSHTDPNAYSKGNALWAWWRKNLQNRLTVTASDHPNGGGKKHIIMHMAYTLWNHTITIKAGACLEQGGIDSSLHSSFYNLYTKCTFPNSGLLLEETFLKLRVLDVKRIQAFHYIGPLGQDLHLFLGNLNGFLTEHLVDCSWERNRKQCWKFSKMTGSNINVIREKYQGECTGSIHKSKINVQAKLQFVIHR